jgi:hypothetical protein
MDITRTIPKTELPRWIDSFFNNSRKGSKEYFPFGRHVKNVGPGDFLYLIYKGAVYGRLEIVKVDQGANRRLPVGTKGIPINAKTIVWVRCPGDRPQRTMRRRSHRGHKYDGKLSKQW